MIIISNPINLADIFRDLYQVKADSAAPENHTGDLIETTLKSYTIPGGTLGITGVIRIKATGVSRGNNGEKTYVLKLGGVFVNILTVVPSESDLFWTLFAACHNLGAVDSQGWSAFWVDGSTIDLNKTATASALNTANDQTLEITGQLVHADDECEVRDWTIEINPT
ncbi:hypothetical protein ES703_47096 [subsurface metagenome]